MILTIGMIVKNEEKYLERCLNGIKPILDNVDSELIITDTGSTDRTVEIAHKFTDKVLHFNWINDFAAARNFGLKKAQGEWFMFLDADDIFESCDDIISFFNTGEYNEYNSAMYITRNMLYSDGGEGYNDIYVCRMVKIEGNTRFENTIHEVINTFSPPYRKISDIAIHYGYYFDNEEKIRKKFERNSKPLLKRLENEKDNPLIYKELYDVYRLVNKDKEALDFLNSGIELCVKNENNYLPVLYFHKASYYFSKNEYDDAIIACDDYFSMSSSVRPSPLSTDSEMYAIKAEALFILRRYVEAVSEYEKFFRVMNEIESGNLSTPEFNLITRYMSVDTTIPRLFVEMLQSCLNIEDYKTADNFLCSFKVYKYPFSDSRINEITNMYIKMLYSYPETDMQAYYNNLTEQGKTALIELMFLQTIVSDKQELLFRQLKRMAEGNQGISEKIRLYELYYGGDNIECALYGFWKKYGYNGDVDLIWLSLINQFDVSLPFSFSNFDTKHTAYLCCRNIEGFYEAAENYNINNISDISVLPVVVKFYDYCISMRLMDNEDRSEEEKQHLISKLFRIKNELNERYKRENSAKSEFELLAETVKKNIRAFIAKGNIDAARKTLEDYKKINPGDPEISEITSQINR